MSKNALEVDVAIVGGGVAGSTLGVVLSRAGMRVAVIEREVRFRDRVRGDSLFPWGATEAARLGVSDVLPESGARPLPIWQTYEDRKPRPPYDWQTDVPTGDVVWGVDHPGIQEALLQLATREGAHVLRPAKGGRPIRVSENSLEVPISGTGAPAEVRARLVVGADGSESGARAWISAATVRDPVHHALVGCLVEGVDLDPDAAHVSRYEGGMSLFFRHASGRGRAYIVCAPHERERYRGRQAAQAVLGNLEDVFPKGAFAGAQVVGPIASFPAHDVFPDRIAGDGIGLVGDAAGANDPAQGQGLSLAFRDVRELSRLLIEWNDWQSAIEEFGRRRSAWYEPLRAYALWVGPLVTDVGQEADAARARARRAADLDPFRGGYGAIQALGPDGLPVTEVARRHFLGENLNEAGSVS